MASPRRVTLEQAKAYFTRLPEIRDGDQALVARENVLRALSQLLGRLVLPLDDPQLCSGDPYPPALLATGAAGRLGGLGHEDGQSLARVLGVHVVDPVAGRFSVAWGAPSAVSNGSVPAEICPHLFWELYGPIWMRTYWAARRDGVTLLSAFHEKLLDAGPPENGVAPLVAIDWSENQDLDDAAEPEGLVCVHLPVHDNFVIETRKLTEEFDKIIAKEIAAALDSVYQREEGAEGEGLLERKEDRRIGWRDGVSSEQSVLKNRFKTRIEDSVLSILSASCVMSCLEDVRNDYLYRVLRDPDLMRGLVEILDRIGLGIQIRGKLLNSSPKDLVLDSEWKRVVHVVEALQSAMLNEPRFCGSAGLLVGSWSLRTADGPSTLGVLRLVIGLTQQNRDAFLPRIPQFSVSVKNALEEANSVLSKVHEHTGIREADLKPDPVEKKVDDIMQSLLVTPGGAGQNSGLSRWVSIVHHLSEAAVHEGQSLRFLLGWGPSYVPTVQGHLYEPAPSHLRSLSTSVEQIIHFAKGYFSLFCDSHRILWFDEAGRFSGVFEGEGAPLASGGWLDGKWDGLDQSYFAMIQGKKTYDLRDRRSRLLVRVIENDASKPGAEEAIDQLISLACGKVLSRRNPWTVSLAKVLSRLVESLQNEAHGAGIVVSVSEGIQNNRSGDWRRPLSDQVKSLVPPLARFDPLVVESDDGRIADWMVDRAVDRMRPFADLDGALWIEVTDSGLRAEGAKQFIPLVESKIGSNSTEPSAIRLLDLVDWSRQWEEESRGRKRSGSLRALNSRLSSNLDIDQYQHALLLAAVARGIVEIPKEHESLRECSKDLAFLNSAGTRHHSMWGISLTTLEKLFVVTMSQDGELRILWGGRVLRL